MRGVPEVLELAPRVEGFVPVADVPFPFPALTGCRSSRVSSAFVLLLVFDALVAAPADLCLAGMADFDVSGLM
jgi:hypothetical protein